MHIFPAGTHTAKYMRYLVERASGVFAVWGMPSTLPETEAFLTVNGGHRSQRLEVLEEFRRLGEVLAGFTAPGLVPEPSARPGGAVADQLVDDVLTTAFEGGSTVDRISELEEAAVRSETGASGPGAYVVTVWCCACHGDNPRGDAYECAHGCRFTPSVCHRATFAAREEADTCAEAHRTLIRAWQQFEPRLPGCAGVTAE